MFRISVLQGNQTPTRRLGQPGRLATARIAVLLLSAAAALAGPGSLAIASASLCGRADLSGTWACLQVDRTWQGQGWQHAVEFRGVHQHPGGPPS